MTEPNKHRRAEPTRRAEPRRAVRPARSERRTRAERPARGARVAEGRTAGGVGGWLRSTAGITMLGGAAFLVVAVLLATLLRAVFWNDDEPAGATPETPGAVTASYGNEWKAPDGSRYEVSVQTLRDQVAIGSPSGCIPTPVPGTTNLHFTVTVVNKGKKDAPVPDVRFGTNVKPSGELLGGTLTFARATKAVEVTPLVKATTCAEGRNIRPAGREDIPAGGTAVFTGTFGPVKTPVPDGVTVVVRYAQDGGEPGDFLATFGKF